MITNFDSVQTLKSREDCYKYSKSVSYETLVGGTTTTGRERKQTQKMFLSSAVKPLTAVGTLTSLLCNSAKVMEKLFYRHPEPKAKNLKKTGTVIIGRGCEPIISAESKRDPRLIAKQSPRMTMLWILRFANASLRMTMKRRLGMTLFAPMFALIFTLFATAESRAESCTERFGPDCMSCDETHCTSYDCLGRYGPNCMSCDETHCTAYDCSRYGPNCMDCNDNECTSCDSVRGYKLENGRCVKINCGEGYILELGTCVPRHPACLSYGPDGLCVECKEGYIRSPGGCVACSDFYDSNCESCTTGGCTSCKEGYMNSPGGCVACSDFFPGGNCTKCDSGLCTECTNGKFVQMGDCVDTCNSELGFIGKEGKCIDKSQGCGEGYQLEGSVCEKLPENCSEAFEKACSKCNNGYLEKDGVCISSANGCGAGYKDMGGWCNRIQYTPAEAAKVLKDDNTNSVTITFKK